MSDEAEHHPVPEWLTAEYLEPVLRRYNKKPTLKIKHLECKAATAKGENYASVMTRFVVDYIVTGIDDTSAAPQRAYYIVKTSYEGDTLAARLMVDYDVCNTEMAMYEKVLPQLSALLREEAGEVTKLFADTVHVDYEHSAIIFEDLTVAGFDVANRVVGMDMEEARLALSKLAKMHAAAAVLNERQGGTLERFDHGIFNRHTNGFGPHFVYVLDVAANFANECKELGPYYAEKLLKLKTRIVAYAEDAQEARPGFFSTLKHGDYWTNNMLCYNEALAKKNGCNGASTKESTIKDLLMIDMQFCAWGSPTVDLFYFFYTSLRTELVLEKEGELVQYYHKVLVETLRQLQYKGHVPSLHEFCVQMEMGRFAAIPSALATRPLLTNDKTEDADFDALMVDDERGRRFRQILYQSESIQMLAKKLLPYFDRKGLLDVVD